MSVYQVSNTRGRRRSISRFSHRLVEALADGLLTPLLGLMYASVICACVPAPFHFSAGTWIPSGVPRDSTNSQTQNIRELATFYRMRNLFPLGGEQHYLAQAGTNTGIQFRVDGSRYRTIQSCIDAARSAGRTATCFVPSATQNTSQVEMASGVTLEFGPGAFTNANPNGGVFIHFGRGVDNATLMGQGTDATILRNASSGKQFGAVVQDEGNGNTIMRLTVDANSNSTSTVIHIQTDQARMDHVKIIHSTSWRANQNYGWDIRGGQKWDVHDIEVVGGPLDAISMTNQDSIASYGTTEGGTFANIYAHDSPHNGIDIRSSGSNQVIRSLDWSNVRVINNGTVARTAQDTRDDESGLVLVATLSDDHSEISSIRFFGITAQGNKGAGIRLKGDIQTSVFCGITSEGNGGGTTGKTGGIELLDGVALSAPIGNIFFGVVRKGAGSFALSTASRSSNNEFHFATGSDRINLSNSRDRVLYENSVPASCSAGNQNPAN